MGKLQIHDDVLRKWVDKYESGIPCRSIAKDYGCSYQTVSSRLKNLGVNVSAAKSLSAIKKGKPSNQLGRKRTQETKNKISEARKGKPTTTGFKFTKEQKEKMRVSRLAYIQNNYDKFQADQKKANAAKKKLDAATKEVRAKTRSAMKRMLRRVLVMARTSKTKTTEKMLGYNKEELRTRLESTFKEGMSWSVRESFHIDHIIPVSWFFENGITDPMIINSLDNLQALYPQENRAKSNKLISKPL